MEETAEEVVGGKSIIYPSGKKKTGDTGMKGGHPWN